MYSFNRNRRGFTLVELLVVITIIIILAAILFPVFARVRRAAQKTSCLSNLREIGNAVRMYTNDWDECYPLVSGFGPALDPAQSLWSAGGTGWINTRSDEMSESRWLPNLLWPYIKNSKLWLCPSVGADGTWAVGGIGGSPIKFADNYARWFINFTNPTAPWAELNSETDPPTTYTFNAWVWGPNTTPGGPPVKLIIAGSSEAICLAAADAPLVWDAVSGRRDPNKLTKVQLAHPGSINVVYADGHAKNVAIDDDADRNIVYNNTTATHAHFWWVEGWKGWGGLTPTLP